MASVGFCGLKPLLFRRKSCALEEMKGSNMPKKRKGQIEGNKESIENSFVGADQLILMMEIQKKILSFRDIMDLAPCNSSASFREMFMKTLEDLQRLYPDIIPSNEVSEIKGKSIYQGLAYFCKALKSLGETWMMDNDWMDKFSYDLPLIRENTNMKQLGQTVLATLDCMIKMASEKFDIMDEDDQKKDFSPHSSSFGKFILGSSFSESNFSGSSSPVTPTSVLPELKYSARTGDSPRTSCTSPLLWSLRVQAVGKLNPIDVKRLSFHMSPPCKIEEESTRDMEVDGKSSNAEKDSSEDLVFDLDTTEELDRKSGEHGEAAKSRAMAEKGLLPSPSPLHPPSPKPAQTPTLLQQFPSSSPSPLTTPMPPPSPSPPPTPSMMLPNTVPLPPTTPPVLQPNVAVAPPPPSPPPSPPSSTPQLQQNAGAVGLPPPPPPPIPSMMLPNTVPLPPPPPTPLVLQPNVAVAPPPPPPPPPTSSAPQLQQHAVAVGLPPPPLLPGSGSAAAAAPRPPPPILKGGSVPAPPPPMKSGNGASPPPPPPLGAGRSLRPKATTKLKRSTQIGNLYRTLKGKVEGSTMNGKSSGGRKSGIGASTGGKQGMADALAEMTKRSSYFQQIEEDVQKYSKQITELRTTITNFKTKDMPELIKFHKDVESVLENLTDESQVLSRFEGFPTKKLEAVRMAAALYNKLDSMFTELQNWKILPPLGQLLDRVERYFNKMKTEVDAMDRTKDEEAKKFKSHNIEFDFQILIKIKEAMVDVSSSCMELALKERREDAAKRDSRSKSDEKTKECVKMLWRAFQFAYRVYTFAGGHDDRADKLTRELAQEIESDPHHT